MGMTTKREKGIVTSAALIHGLRVLEQYEERLVGEGFERSWDGDLSERLEKVVNALKLEPLVGARLLGGERDDGPPAFLFIGDGPGSHKDASTIRWVEF